MNYSFIFAEISFYPETSNLYKIYVLEEKFNKKFQEKFINTCSEILKFPWNCSYVVLSKRSMPVYENQAPSNQEYSSDCNCNLQ